ncbi:MAG: ABC transporter permease subunit [Acidimicrobiaceae bacterium]|nr:ABC transporter permease subunit [Acidimicrobiaceae bacterium]MYI35141.1 ABC transporter permease subunit [Acidimicrobiaceae bacterium]
MSQRVLATSFWDNANLDAWEIPFGLWIEEIVFWLTTHIKGFLDAVKWPVDKLLELIIDNLLQDWLPWPVVLLMFFLLGVATRNILVGLGSAAGLLICGLLGNEYWDLTMETLGMIIVAVLICTVIGIPLGILAARVDAFWSRLRPVLDGMQVIHPFVYLLPIIFLFGVRRTPGVLATLVFALPPIVRLTNLGIRQVPSDVVEAARAFGATEFRILREVQMPLARPSIMAGLNQTLLLSLSMVGIVAIIAGGGLGKPILTALNTADIPVGASAGAGLYFVGVLLDRISQPEESDDRRSLLARIRSAWVTRIDPVVPGVPGMEADPETPTLAGPAAPAAPRLTVSHRIGAAAALIGGLLAAFSVLLTWGNDAGLLSGWARFDDNDLPGAHSGLDATGGSWFGIVFGLVALVVAFGGASALWRPRSREKFMAGGAAFLAAGLVLASLAAAYLTVSPRGENYSHGPGVWLGLLGALIVLGGGAAAALRMRSADEPARASPRELAGMVVLTLFLVFAGASGSWILDQRSDAAQIAAELAAEAEGADQGGLAAEVLAEALAETRRVVVRGLDTEGPGIGYIVLALTVASLAATLGRLVRSHAAQRYLGIVLFGLGCAITAVGMAWIASFVRLATPALSPGASAFLVVVGGLIVAARGWRVSSLT